MSGAVTTTNKSAGKLTIRDHLNGDAFKAEVARVLPRHLTPERMVRTGLTALMKVPKLATCTPESFLNCMLQLSQWGLEPDGRHAHLIPYGDTCTLILDYKGIVDLVLRSGTVRTIHADVVCQGDRFVYSLGEVKEHTPWYLRTDADKPAKAGEVIAVYCHVVFTDGGSKSEVMSVDEVEKVRRASKASQSGPWKEWWSEMAKKTVFRRASKWLKLSAEVADAFERDDQQFVHNTANVGKLSTLNEWTPPAIEAPAMTLQEAVDQAT
jgi:recombination protein RecT